MGSKDHTLHDLILRQVKDLYYAERHMAKALAKMAKAAQSEALQTALERRHDEAETRLERLDACFAALDKKAHGIPCEAMDGIIAETKDLIHTFEDSPAIDAGLIGAAEAMEHYALARYGALRRWAAAAGVASDLAPVEASLAEAQAALGVWAGLGTGAIAATAPMTLKDAALMGIG